MDADRTLVAEAAAGSREAFDELVTRYQARIYGLARTLTGGDADAEDLVQETFVGAFRAVGSFRCESSFHTWLYRIAVTGLLLHRYLEPPLAAGAPTGFVDGPAPARLVTVMADELDLSSKQQRQLESILDARRQKLGELRKTLRTHFHREGEEVGTEITRILTPEQRQRFDALISRMQARYWQRDRPGGFN